MAELTKMIITGYEKSDYKGDYKKFTTQFNPASLSWSKGIAYQHENDKAMYSGSKEKKYKGYKDDKLSFKIILDSTGVLLNLRQPTKKSGSSQQRALPDMINNLEDVLYKINPESHEPRYVKIVWGKIEFYGRLNSLNYEFTLFSPDGIPLRVTISFSFSSHLNKRITNKKYGLQSPDLTRVITLKAGESIADWCDKIYNDSSFCSDVAKCNGLSSFRNVEPGISLIFPPLNRYDRISDKE